MEEAMQNPLAHSIAEAAARSGIGRTVIYELINAGQLPARKCGRRTLILHDDLQRCLESLPSVEVKADLTCDRENLS
jgi:excisionase family DNA binding protein